MRVFAYIAGRYNLPPSQPRFLARLPRWQKLTATSICKSQPITTLGSVVLSFPAKRDCNLTVHTALYEYSCISSPLAARDILQERCLGLNNRNSILTTQINLYMINLALWTSPNNNYIDHFRSYNTLRVIKHFSHKVTNSDKKCMCQWKVATQRDCLEVPVLFCFEAHGFCTDYSLPVSSCPLRELFFKACSVI